MAKRAQPPDHGTSRPPRNFSFAPARDSGAHRKSSERGEVGNRFPMSGSVNEQDQLGRPVDIR
jgi:hypothetical protein